MAEPSTFKLYPERWPTLPPNSVLVVERLADRPGFFASIPTINTMINVDAISTREAIAELAGKVQAICDYRLSRLYRCAADAMRPGRHDRGWPKVAANG